MSSNIPEFTEDEYDFLGEITNMAMGQAGSALAEFLEVFVELSVPMVKIVEAGQIIPVLSDMTQEYKEVSATRQAFYNSISGEVISLFNKDACVAVADLMGYDEQLDPAKEEELILELSNILVGACINGLGGLIKTEVSFSKPAILCERMPIKDLLNSVFAPEKLNWDYTLILKVDFKLEEREFKSDLLIFMSDESIEVLRNSSDKFL